MYEFLFLTAVGCASAFLELFPELRKRLEYSGTISDFEWWGLLEVEQRFNRKEG